MRIQHNIAAMNSYRNYTNNASALSKNLEKLSSGYRINRAGDDAAGLAISEKMRAQIAGLDQAQANVKDGISLVKTAEGALQEVQDMMNRMVTLATQSANGTYQDEVDRENLQAEVDALKSEINRIADSSNFNGQKLLNGELAGGSMTTDGVSMISRDLSKFSAAELDVTGLNADLTAIDAAAAKKEYFSIDGQTLELDTSKGVGKEIAALLDKDLSTLTTQDEWDALAEDLTEKFNQAISEAGLEGEVKITSSGVGNLTLASVNEGADSEFSFTGVEKGGTIDTSVGAHLFAGATPADGAVVNEASQDYNGDAILANETFQMIINGQKMEVKIGAAMDNAISCGAGQKATTMSAAATTLQTAIQSAVTAYNTALGLTAGKKDDASGLTGLTSTDFTVEADKSGGFLIKYTGDEEVSFSFEDIGDKNVADRLGLVSGSSSKGGVGGLTLQIGDTADSYNQLNVAIDDMHTAALGIDKIDISNIKGAQAAIETIKTAINTVSSTRGNLGAIQNRLEHTQNNLSVMAENIQDAESTIRDTDVADEMTTYTKNNILLQSAQAMLAQANQMPQGVLQLLQ